MNTPEEIAADIIQKLSNNDDREIDTLAGANAFIKSIADAIRSERAAAPQPSKSFSEIMSACRIAGKLPKGFAEYWNSRKPEYPFDLCLETWQAATLAERKRVRDALPSDEEILKHCKNLYGGVIALDYLGSAREWRDFIRDRIGIGEREK